MFFITFFLFYLLGFTRGAEKIDENCHPVPNPGHDIYIVGYGSLLSSPSKAKTYPNTGPNIPVEVNGFSRKWNCKGASVGLSTTYLGVDVDPKGIVNGVIFKIPTNNTAESIAEFDKREIYYCRKELKRDQFRFLVNESSGLEFPSPNSQFWVYDVKPEFISYPSIRYPIVQTYVDVFIAGCLEVEETFSLKGYADKCYSGTEGWNYPWVNDRPIPRRPFVNQPKAYKIDSFLEKHIPDLFHKALVETEILLNNQKINNNGCTNLRMNLPLCFLLIVGTVFKYLF